MLQMTKPRIVRSIDELRAVVRDWRRAGDMIALTPTMGGLHEGHLSLIRTARQRAKRVIATIFVNPTQFGPGEDYDRYPREEAQDAFLLEQAGVDMLYIPDVREMYPSGFVSSVHVNEITEPLCGSHRPGHFDGVTTVVCKLLNQAQPDYAVFGEKDWQQLTAIRRMVRDLDMPVRIIGSPTMREADGLAMSSRNRYLSPENRRIAAKLNRALYAAADHIARGMPVSKVLTATRRALLEAGFHSVEYLEARHALSLAPMTQYSEPGEARLFVAAKLGNTRLIDNVPIERAG